ncbi:hypothetical protein BC828DRAFT_382140, partial [Blastocladiella britannica]
MTSPNVEEFLDQLDAFFHVNRADISFGLAAHPYTVDSRYCKISLKKMARKARGSAAAPVRTAAPSRPATTAAAPMHHAPAPAALHPTHAPPMAAAPQQPSMFAQMATTAAGVAVGSAVGHTLGAGLTSMFGGGSSAPAPAPAAPVEQAQPMYYSQQSSAQNAGGLCEADLKAYMKCMETNSEPSTCNYYFDMLKACQGRLH